MVFKQNKLQEFGVPPVHSLFFTAKHSYIRLGFYILVRSVNENTLAFFEEGGAIRK